MIPAPRLALALGFVGLVGLVVAPVFGDSIVIAGAAGVVLIAALDWVLLLRSERPQLAIDAPQIVHLRSESKFQLKTTASTIVDLAVPEALGGPLPPVAIDTQAGVAFVPRARGRWVLPSAWCWQDSRVGLWKRRTKVDSKVTVEVWPDVVGDASGLGMAMDEGVEASRVGLQRGSLELRGLRPFANGDDLRHVDWKATARREFPVVREWEPERHRLILFALDSGRLMRSSYRGETKFDAALRAVAQVAIAAGSFGDRVGAVVYDYQTRRFVPPLNGRNQAPTLLRQLNDLEPTFVRSDFSAAVPHLLSYRRRALVAIVTDVSDADEANTLVCAAGRIGSQHLPVALLLRDPGTDALLERRVSNRSDAYVRAAAEIVSRHRRGVIQSFGARGFAAVDTSMQHLAMHSVRMYLEARNGAAW